MNLKEFLADSLIALPLRRENDDFIGFIDALLDGFRGKLDQLEDGPIKQGVQQHRERLDVLCEETKRVVEATFQGYPSDAYQHFLSAIEPVSDLIESQSLSGIGQTDLRIMYRVRRSHEASLSREAMFHLPFEKRHFVSTQRYSIPGLPCLYLGGSLYTCWAEMGYPPFHELHTAAFWLTNGTNLKILNLSNRPARLSIYVNPNGDVPNDERIRNLLINNLSLWPLTALCSIVVRHRDSPYKPEYIFPQLVLEWITKEHEYDGVSYFSTHVDAVTNHPLPTANLVFPSREMCSTGHCGRLRQRFHMTSPLQWSLLTAIQAGEGMPGHAVPNYNFVFVDGRQEPYSHTHFGEIESKLNKIAYGIMFKNANGEPDLGKVVG